MLSGITRSAVLVAALLFSFATARAATINVDISNLAGFQIDAPFPPGGPPQNFNFVSPIYNVTPGSIVDFGTALVIPFHDGRQSCSYYGTCDDIYVSGIYILRNGAGGYQFGDPFNFN